MRTRVSEPLQILLRGYQSCLVHGLARFRLIERCLVEAGIDFGQHVAFVDALTLLEENVLKLAVDLGVDGDSVQRLHSP